MKQKDIFGYVIDVLNRLNISYMISGSIASIAYGKPRLTYDMDIVIDFDKNQAKDFASSFGKEWSVNLEDILQAIQKREHFNIIHFKSGNKIDFFVRKDSEFGKTEFRRRRKEKFDQKRQASFASPEDILQAIQKREHFNIIHFKSGNKIDFFVRKDSEFAKTEFKRRRKEKFDQKRQASFASPEDIIIKKLDYYRQGASAKHLEDIRGILEISGKLLDFDYITRWTQKKGANKIWKKLRTSV